MVPDVKASETHTRRTTSRSLSRCKGQLTIRQEPKSYLARWSQGRRPAYLHLVERQRMRRSLAITGVSWFLTRPSRDASLTRPGDGIQCLWGVEGDGSNALGDIKQDAVRHCAECGERGGRARTGALG